MTPFVHVFGKIVAEVQSAYDLVDGIRPFYEYGHPLQIFNTLVEKTQSGEWKYKKYPLIALYQTFSETRRRRGVTYVIPEITVMLMTDTKDTFRSNNRYDNTYLPILHPIRDLLIDRMNYSRLINFDSEYTSEDLIHWGTENYYAVTQNEGHGYLDALELKFRNVLVHGSCNKTYVISEYDQVDAKTFGNVGIKVLHDGNGVEGLTDLSEWIVIKAQPDKEISSISDEGNGDYYLTFNSVFASGDTFQVYVYTDSGDMSNVLTVLIT